MNRISLDTLVGPVTIRGDWVVRSIGWGAEADDPTPVLSRAAEWMRAYFRGDPAPPDMPVALGDTPFQRAFSQALLEVPFGTTLTYGDLARRLDVSAQAVGQACGANPLPILIPCHRVLGSTSLGGYSGSGGVETKVTLLRHEGAAGLLI